MIPLAKGKQPSQICVTSLYRCSLLENHSRTHAEQELLRSVRSRTQARGLLVPEGPDRTAPAEHEQATRSCQKAKALSETGLLKGHSP